MSQNYVLSKCVKDALKRYLNDLDGEKPSGIYEMVMMEVEKSMIEIVMLHANGNQTVAAEMLGINRNTLRRKLSEHSLL